MRFCQDCRNLQALHLTTRECTVHLAVQIIRGTKSDCRKQSAAFGFAQFLSSCQRQHSCHRHTLKTRRLLKRVTDARIGTVVDIITGNIFIIQKNLALIRFFNSGQYLGQRRFAAAIWTGNHQHLAIRNLKADMIDQTALSSLFIHLECEVLYL